MSALEALLTTATAILLWSNGGPIVTLVLTGLLLLSIIGLAGIRERGAPRHRMYAR